MYTLIDMIRCDQHAWFGELGHTDRFYPRGIHLKLGCLKL
jgi:hypothetical protein